MSGQDFTEFATIAVGTALFIFRYKFAQKSAEFQNENFGLELNKQDMKKGVIFITIFSLGLIVAGIVSWLEITDFKI